MKHKNLHRVVGMAIMTMAFVGAARALEVSPSYQLFLLKPNQTGQGEFTVTNSETEATKVTPSSKDWFVLPENRNSPAADWLQISSEPFVLKPGESRKVSFTLVPSTTAVGELAGMASFLMESPDHESSINMRVSAAVYVGMEASTTIKGELAAFTLNAASGTLTAGIMVKNSGNVHLRPRGSIEIKRDKKNSVAFFYIDKGGPVFPGMINSYFADVKGFELAPGKYVAHVTIKDSDRNADVFTTETKFTYTKDKKVELR